MDLGPDLDLVFDSQQDLDVDRDLAQDLDLHPDLQCPALAIQNNTKGPAPVVRFLPSFTTLPSIIKYMHTDHTKPQASS